MFLEPSSSPGLYYVKRVQPGQSPRTVHTKVVVLKDTPEALLQGAKSGVIRGAVITNENNKPVFIPDSYYIKPPTVQRFGTELNSSNQQEFWDDTQGIVSKSAVNAGDSDIKDFQKVTPKIKEPSSGSSKNELSTTEKIDYVFNKNH